MKKREVKSTKATGTQHLYECLYIIENTVNDEKRKELIDKFAKMAGSDCKVEKWGMKKFATPINYANEGFYVLMNFSASPDLVAKISSLMNITEGIVRYMFVCKDEKQIAQDAARKAARREAREAKIAASKTEKTEDNKKGE